VYIEAADGTGRTQLTKLGGCDRPLFTKSGDQILFFRIEWPRGPTGLPKSSIWSIGADGQNLKEVADRNLFDDPLKWKPRTLP
jgi:hypothetical protein